MAIIQVRNTGADGVWTGQTILAGATFTISETKRRVWRSNAKVFTDVANGTLVVGDGVKEFTDVVQGWNWMLGDTQPRSDLGDKLAVHASTSPDVSGMQHFLVWTGAGDDMVTGAAGDGPLIILQNSVGQATTSMDIEFHPDNGRTDIHEGYARWTNGGIGDYLTARIYVSASTVQTSVNLDLELAGNEVKPAAGGAGTGTHGWSVNPNLVPRPYSKNGFWDYDATNGLQPNLGGTGEFAIYTVETLAHKFHNKLPTDGTCNTPVIFTSDKTAYFPTGSIVRITTYNTSDTVWHASIFFEVYREKTI